VKQGVLSPANISYLLCFQLLLLQHRKLIKPNMQKQYWQQHGNWVNWTLTEQGTELYRCYSYADLTVSCSQYLDIHEWHTNKYSRVIRWDNIRVQNSENCL